MILLYHHVAPPEVVPAQPHSAEGWQWTHSPTGFERQLTKLGRLGYRFVRLDDLVRQIHKHGAEPPRIATVTFDDGWLDNYQFAFPILKKLSVPAAFFVTSAHLGNGTADPRKMNLGQLKELAAAGMTIGSHTRSHPDLTRIPPDQAKAEIAGCKDDLERALGIPVRFFAYPGGAFNREVWCLTEEAGYAAACSVLGPRRNDRSSLFWLYRDVLTESMRTWGDRYRLSPSARSLLSFRIAPRLRSQLMGQGNRLPPRA